MKGNGEREKGVGKRKGYGKKEEKWKGCGEKRRIW